MQRLCGQAHRLSHGLHPIHSIPPGGGQIQAGAIKGRGEICNDTGLYADAARCEPRKARREATLLMSGITEQEYAAWLEKALQALYKSKPLAIAIVAKTESGNTLTGYYNADAQDKAVFAHHIQSDIVLDIIKANAAEIKAMMEGVDDGTD